MGRVFGGIGLQGIKPLTGTVISLIFGWLLSLVVSLIFQFDALISVSLVELGWLAIVGILGFALGRGLTFLGIKHIGTSRSTTAYASYPLITVVLAVLFLGESAGAALLLGILLIIGGVGFLILEREPEKRMAAGANRLLGYGFSLAAAVFYGSNSALIKWVVTDMVHPLVTATYSLFFAMVILLAIGGRGLVPAMVKERRSAAFFALAGMAMTVGAMSFNGAVYLAPAVVVTPLGSTSPLFTLLGTFLLMRRLETVTYHVLLGCLMVVAGGVLVTIG